MDEQQRRSRLAGGARPQQPAAAPENGSGTFHNPSLFFQTPPAFSPHFQNQNFLLQHPIWPFQSPGVPVQNLGFSRPRCPSSVQTQNFSDSLHEHIEKIDRAVSKARHDLLAAGEAVSAWKVSQNALLMLQVDSWSSLGIKMQQVPSLHRLMITEGKVNAFVHCFVGVRRITSLYDLEVAICQNEGVECFETLGLGPLMRHPLIMHYFSIHSDVTEVSKITTEEIINFLCELVDSSKNKEIRVEEFLDFIAKKRSVKCREWLGIRVQNLGMHISAIREAKFSEGVTLEKCLKSSRVKSEKFRKFPMSSSQKKQLDERFSAISQRVESFSSVEKIFCGEHIRFNSSSSENEDSDDYADDDQHNNTIVGSHSNASSQFGKSSDRVSSCPYPSATEEMTRLGLRGSMQGHSPANDILEKGVNGQFKRKRRSENVNCKKSASSKLLKKEKIVVGADPMESCKKIEVTRNMYENFSITNDSLQMFVTTWKEACLEHGVGEVLERMLQFYEIKPRRQRKVRLMFSSFPFIGLLNAAVSSIKSGMWNSMYDAFQAVGHNELTSSDINKNSDYQTTDVGPSVDVIPVLTYDNSENIMRVSAEDIIRRIGTYFDLDNEVQRNSNFSLQNRFLFLRKLWNCESWVAEQFCVKNFTSLGYGEFLVFLDKNVSQLPHEVLKFLMSGICEKSSFVACMPSNQLTVLVSQALSTLWENETVTKQMISLLLTRQFPSIGFEVTENGSLEDFLDIVGKHRASVTSKCVIFSATMTVKYQLGDSLGLKDIGCLEMITDRFEAGKKTMTSGNVTSKNAIDVLLRAPMLSDLSKWAHWDLIFAPFLGSLVSWLLNDVNTKELLCLVTKDGKVIRVDHSATLDSFLEAAVQGSSFQTAVKLLSLFALVGGEKFVPLSLLKCHARRAFEVMLRNTLENMEAADGGNSLLPGEALCRMEKFTEMSTSNMRSELCKHLHKIHKAVPILARFVLDCLAYIPSEIHYFATDVLFSGMQSIFKDAASAILCECSNMEQRLMLHEVGLSLGISEWINDYHAFNSKDTAESFAAGELCSKAARAEISTGLKHNQHHFDKSSVSDNDTVVSLVAGAFNEVCAQMSLSAGKEKSNVKSVSGCLEGSCRQNEDEDAALVIESIRRDEFGLVPSLSDFECSMLKKQHARLGRALHCLSQELYSQDSHFILELVQNADDNIYPENVEPTLTFILRDSGIIVLNNEQGFSAQNIRALCDVGNSTKKGSNAGYIGQKGIGFKSVFRVTDAPEIHSNGFHVKFDVSQGQIGFVLPTVVPPCNIDLFSRMAASGTDSSDYNLWNTCIVLPFRSHLSEGTVMNNILTMFSDLHPSLLLFLHRLQCIKLRNMLDDTLIVMRKEITGDGIIKVSHGKEKMAWFVVSQKLQTNSIRPDVQITEISIAFTLQESDNGYCPCLDLQPVFAYLPLRMYGLKFILQGDFVLPSSREEVDGDSPWNQWLLSEYPSLFVRAEREFCALPCFRGEPGKALSAFLSFVPLVGEVHGFFSSLPRLIISKLRMANCLLVEGDNNGWVPPCRVLRGWTEQVRDLLPDGLLHEHLGLRYLDKNIVLSDTLACALGIEEFGPNILVQLISSLCHTKGGMVSIGISWLASCLNILYIMLFNSSGKMSANFEIREDILRRLQKIPFIPLSDGTYSSVDEGTIWLHSDFLSTGFDGEHKIEAFPNICAKLQTINPSLFLASFSDSSITNVTFLDNVSRLLQSIGVQRLSAHDIVRMHILPCMFEQPMTNGDKMVMIEYICFVMLHLKSSCSDCFIEKEDIISELQSKSLLSTNCGFKCPTEEPIHFSKEFGNPVNAKLLADFVNMNWHEIDVSYLNHPVNELLSCGLTKWREFFLNIGITDFAQTIQVDKSVADVSDATFKQVIWDRGLISPESIAKDWESPELVKLVSLLSKSGNQENCKYLLEVLDTLWDACYSDKSTGYFYSKSGGDGYPFRSAFICSLCELRWVVSTMDDELHYPKDLFFDCEAVRMILGDFAPYAVPKVKSERLISDVGFKTRVTLADILDILKVWRNSKTPFKASITQMSKLYAFVWNEMATTKQKTIEELMSGPFIFIPYSSVSGYGNVVCGMFLSPCEVYWSDSTGSVEQMKELNSKYNSTETTRYPIDKSLCNIYPGLRGFFVDECKVQEAPPLRSYIQILRQLSTLALPSQAANKVFQVLLKWADGLNSGLLSTDDVMYLKECLSKVEFAVLPTVQDKWVSLHPLFGLVCWCDDKKLKKQFKHSDNLDFVYFGELTDDNNEIFQQKISILMKSLGIPALSEVVTREAIYYGLADSSLKASLVNWALPYAQRYVYKLHSDKYFQLKQTGFDTVNRLRVIVVEKLFYRNVIKSCGSVSKKRVECSCLLQEDVLYTTQESDYHSLFMELSCLLFDGPPALHLANFLHMITAMAESGSPKEQIEFFMVNSQRVPKLPDEESVWSLSSVSSVIGTEKSNPSDDVPLTNEQVSRRRTGVNSHWPPVDWKTAPDFNYARINGFKTQAAQISSYIEMKKDEDSESNIGPPVCADSELIVTDWTIKDEPAERSVALVLHENDKSENQSCSDYEQTASSLPIGFSPVSLGAASIDSNLSSLGFSKRDQLQTGTPDAEQAKATGRLGELLAFKYFVGKVGRSSVKWVNEVNETGLPYDIVVGDGTNKEFIEVKATRSPKKDWFIISMREWQFAVDKGESFSIAHVALMGNNVARITEFKDPVKLCQLGELQLAVMMPKQQKDFSIVT